jgi:hypothetical protein
MKFLKNIGFFLTTITLLSSCEEVIELELGNTQNNIVIEGNINNLPGPYYVKLTRTVNVNQPSVFPVIENAQVIISDNVGQSESLIYVGDGVYQTQNLQGIEGRTYSLEVNVDGATYMAQSTMPTLVKLDSLKIQKFAFAGIETNSILPVFTDPKGLRNYYKFVLKVDGVQDNSFDVENDNITDGSVNQRPVQTQTLEILSGSVVEVEMRSIDAATYLYYYTLNQTTDGGPGGGTTPSNPPNGISGGALGLFSAYTSQRKTIEIP